MKIQKFFRLTVLLVATSVAAFSPSATAANATWSGTTDATWAGTGNWSATPVPGTGDTATFNNGGNANTTINLGGGVTVSNLLFDTTSAAPYTIGSGAVGSQTLTLGQANGGIALSSTVTSNQTLNANLALAATGSYYLINNSATNVLMLVGTNSTTSAGIKVMTVDGTGATTISGPTVSGTGTMNLVKTNSGTLTLSGGARWDGNGVNCYLPGSALVPVDLRAGATIMNSGTYTNNGEFVVGGVIANSGAGNNVSLTLNNSAALGNSSWFSLGRGNGIGGVSSDVVLNNSASILTANCSAGFNGAAGNLPKGSLSLNNSSTFTVLGNGAFYIGESAGSSMTMTMNNTAQFTAAGTGAHRIGGGGAGVLNINDSALFSANGAALIVGYVTGSGLINLNSGTMNVGGLQIAVSTAAANVVTGAVNIASGTLTSSGDVIVGLGGTQSGKLVMNGGTLNVGTTVTKWLQVGEYDSVATELDLTNGNINLNTSTSIKFNTQNSSGAHTVNQEGGTVTFYSDNATTVGGTGNLDLRNNTSTGANTYNLDGGTLTIPQIISTKTTGTRVFNFNGGTLKAATASASFFAANSASAANVLAGGAIIDCNGYDITIGQPLLNGGGGLTKKGTGTLTLSGTCTYAGNTLINAGRLSISSSGSLAAGSAVTVSTATASAALGGAGTANGTVTLNASSGGNNAAISLTNAAAETLTLAGGLTLNTGNILNLDVATAGADLINVTGGTYSDSAVSAGGVTVNLTSMGAGITTGGTINLLALASGAPDLTKFTLATPAPNGYAWQLQISGSTLQLAITQTAPPVAFWKGGLSGNWSAADSGGSFNWATDITGATSVGVKPGGSTAVTFTTTGAGNLTTTLGGGFAIGSLEFNSAYSPSSVTIGGANVLTNAGWLTLDAGAGAVTISANGYVLGADATIANNSSSDLTVSSPVSGAHALTINNAGSGVTKFSGNNSYTGPTTVSAGTLVLSGNNTSATGAVTNNSTLQLQNANALAGSVLALNNGSTLQLRADASTAFNTASAGSFAAAGTFNLDVNNTSSGTGNTLTLGSAITLGANGVTTFNVTGGNNYTLSLGAIAQSDGAGLTLNVSAGVNLNLPSFASGAINGAQQNLTFSGDGNTTIGAITQTSPVANGGRDIQPVLNQTGTVTLTGTNDFFHGLNRGCAFTINSGTLVISNSAALNTSTLGTSQAFTLGSTAASANNVNFLLGTPGSTGGLTTGSSANKINSFVVQDADAGVITLGGQNTSGINTFSGNFTLGASGGKSVTLLAATGGEVDFAGNLLANGADTTAGITVGDSSHGGTVKLTGVNTYLGGTVVNGGKLWMSALTGAATAGAITVNDGGALSVSASGTSQLTPSTLTLGSSSGATNTFLVIASTTTAPIHATSLVLNGATIINISSGTFQVGQTYPLIAYDGVSGSGSVVLGGLPPLLNGTLNNDGSLISLTITSVAPEIWSGAASGTWDFVANNWKIGSTTTNYLDGSQVLFNDAATGTTAITNIASISPSSMTVSNNSKAYSFAGGVIGGNGSLTKNGNGTLTLDTTLTNTYSGGTFINAGTLAINLDANLGAAAALGLNAGTLSALTNVTLNSGRTVTVGPASGSGNATVNVQGTNVLTVNNPINNNATGTGALIKTGTGTLALGGNNGYSGGTTLNAGTILLPNGSISAFGTGVLNLNNNATLVVRPSSGSAWNSANSIYLGNSVVVQAGQTNLVDNSVNNFGNLWVGNNSATWTGSGTVKFVNSSGVSAPAVLWCGSPLSGFTGRMEFGSATGNYHMYVGIAYQAGDGGISTFDAAGTAWNLGDTGNSLAQVVDAGCTLVRIGSLEGANTANEIRSQNPCTFEIGALNTTTTYAGRITGGASTSLTKVGTGTLTLSGANTYTGNTTINGGSLEIAQAVIGTSSTVSIASGAKLKLDFTATNRVGTLVLNGVSQPGGTYNAGNTPAYFSAGGAGSLLVTASNPTNITVSASSSTMTLSWPADHLGWVLQAQTNSLDTGLSTDNWVDVPGSDSSTTSVITMDPTAPTVFYRLRNP